METSVVSPQYEVLIPQTIRQACALRPGQEVRIVGYERRIELIPVTSITAMRGFLKGIDTTIDREDDRV